MRASAASYTFCASLHEGAIRVSRVTHAGWTVSVRWCLMLSAQTRQASWRSASHTSRISRSVSPSWSSWQACHKRPFHTQPRRPEQVPPACLSQRRSAVQEQRSSRKHQRWSGQPIPRGHLMHVIDPPLPVRRSNWHARSPPRCLIGSLSFVCSIWALWPRVPSEGTLREGTLCDRP